MKNTAARPPAKYWSRCCALKPKVCAASDSYKRLYIHWCSWSAFPILRQWRANAKHGSIQA